MDLRNKFVDTLIDIAKNDNSIILLTGDLGFNFLERFRDTYPNQFLNCGIMEQSMVGIAAGMALAGKKPYVYSTAPFITYRALEQVRDDICYQNLNVKLIGVKMSGFIGFTHTIFGNEDIDLFKNLPNITAYAPQSEEEAKEIMINTYKNEKATYIRI